MIQLKKSYLLFSGIVSLNFFTKKFKGSGMLVSLDKHCSFLILNVLYSKMIKNKNKRKNLILLIIKFITIDNYLYIYIEFAVKQC